jgi:hypothetical protein
VEYSDYLVLVVMMVVVVMAMPVGKLLELLVVKPKVQPVTVAQIVLVAT